MLAVLNTQTWIWNWKLKLIVIEFRLRSYLHAHCTKIRPKAVKESIYQAPPYVAQTHKCTKVRTYGKQLIHNYIYMYTHQGGLVGQLVWAVGLTALVPLLSILICTWCLSNKLSAKLNLLILEAFHEPNYRSKVYEDPLFQAKLKAFNICDLTSILLNRSLHIHSFFTSFLDYTEPECLIYNKLWTICLHKSLFLKMYQI